MNLVETKKVLLVLLQTWATVGKSSFHLLFLIFNTYYFVIFRFEFVLERAQSKTNVGYSFASITLSYPV